MVVGTGREALGDLVKTDSLNIYFIASSKAEMFIEAHLIASFNCLATCNNM